MSKVTTNTTHLLYAFILIALTTAAICAYGWMYYGGAYAGADKAAITEKWSTATGFAVGVTVALITYTVARKGRNK